MWNRRNFLKTLSLGSATLMTDNLLYANILKSDLVYITILHTNDTHSRIDPFESGSLKGRGGVAKRASLIQNIRATQKNVLLLDAGDVFQGTPYFNLYNGELEIKLMSHLGYNAATMGNHDFDAGLDGFATQLQHADFDFITTNYNFDNTILKDKTKKYKIFELDGIKIGILGLGVEMYGLVPEHLYADTIYEDPLKHANNMAAYLKNEKQCDYIICLSHLGYKYKHDQISDILLAQNTRNIDLIIGGHTHTFLKQPDSYKNLDQKPTYINQVGWAGVILGKIDLVFEKSRKKYCQVCKNVSVK